MSHKHFMMILTIVCSLAYGAFVISIFAEASHQVMLAQQEGY